MLPNVSVFVVVCGVAMCLHMVSRMLYMLAMLSCHFDNIKTATDLAIYVAIIFNLYY